MSSPSDNTSSGRSSPEDGLGSMHGFSRRSSTPAQSFLPPRFWGTQPHYQQQHYQQQQQYDAAASSVPRRTSFGTTFSNGGRLSALSALGMSPHTNPALYGYTNQNKTSAQQQQQQQSNQQAQEPSQTSSSTKRTLSPASSALLQQSIRRSNTDNAVSNSAETTPTPSMPSSPVQKPKRSVYLLPGPDGLCVESRGRRRSEA